MKMIWFVFSEKWLTFIILSDKPDDYDIWTFLDTFGLTYCKSTVRPVFAQNSTQEKHVPFSI